MVSQPNVFGGFSEKSIYLLDTIIGFWNVERFGREPECKYIENGSRLPRTLALWCTETRNGASNSQSLSLSLSLSLLHTNIAELKSVYQDELFFKVKKNNKFIGLESPLLVWPPFFPEFFK